MADNIAFKITVDTEVGELSVGELKQGFKQLQEEISKTKVGTEAYKQTLLKMGEVKGALTDLRQQMIALDPEKRFRAFAQVGSSIASGFAAAQGAMALFGSESEDLNKVLVRVQAAMALASGLQGLAGFGKALQTAGLALKAFMMSNPLGLLVAGAVALAGALVVFKDKMIGAGDAAVNLEKKLDLLKTANEAINRTIDKEILLLEAQGESEEKIMELKRKKILLSIEEAKMSLQIASTKFIEAEANNTLLESLYALTGQADKFLLSRAERLGKAMKEMKDAQKLLEDVSVSLMVMDAKIEKSRNDTFKKETEQRKKDFEEFQKDLNAVNGEAHQKTIELAKDRDERAKDEEKKRQDANKQAFEDEKALAEFRLAYKDAMVKAELELEQAKWNGLITLSQIGQQLAGKNKALADTFFLIEKGLAIAGIVVNTQKEISGYWANPIWKLSPDGGVGLATAASLAAKIRAATSIATILATTVSKFMNGSGGSGAIGGGSGPSIGGGSAPSIQSPQNSLSNATTPIVQGPGGPEFGGRMMKAYVVESELTDTQKNIKSIQERTTF